MAIAIDTAKALRGVADLERLVRAVETAGHHDEADWIEWKGPLDLGTKEGCFHVARAVLGMANRMVDQARLTCDGVGYVVAGVEPRNLVGVETVDPADLVQRTEPYLGGPIGPRWTPTWLLVDGKNVLVATVEPPRPGDPIFTLRREFTSSRSGLVYVRKAGKTEPANAGDLDALQSRLVVARAPLEGVEVDLVGDVPISWIEPMSMPAEVNAWVMTRKAAMVTEAKAAERRANPPALPEANADKMSLLGLSGAPSLLQQMVAENQLALMTKIEASMTAAGILGTPDTRTLGEFLGEVDVWDARVREAVPEVVVANYFRAGFGVVALQVNNPTGRFLADAEVIVEFDDRCVRILAEEPPPAYLPSPPAPFGERRTLSAFPDQSPLLSAISAIAPMLPVTAPPRRTWIEGERGIRFHVGDLRQFRNDVSRSLYVLVAGRPEGGVLTARWTATFRDQDGAVKGTLEIPLEQEPVGIRSLLDDPDPDDD